MKSLVIFSIFILSVLCASKYHLSSIQHYETLHDEHISMKSTHKRGLENLEIELSIKCFGTEYKLALHQNKFLFTEDSKVFVYDSYGNVMDSYTSPRIAYREKFGSELVSRITILDENKLKVKGTWSTEEETYFIDPIEDHLENMPNKRDIDLSTVSHVIYKESDLVSGGIPLYKIPKKQRNVLADAQGINYVPPQDSLQAVIPAPAPCPTTLKMIVMSTSSDYGFTNLVGGQTNARNDIINNFNLVSALYEKTLNIMIQLNVIDIRLNASDSPTWNAAGGCPDIQTKLNQISGWRGSQEQTAALWHVKTNCYAPPGTIGLAWVGVTCMTKSINGGERGNFSGTGVSTYLKGSDGYRVVAHEVGHNFNGQHESAGIMLPNLTPVDYFSQVSQSQMCTHIQSTTSKCYKNPPAGLTCTANCTNKVCGTDGCGGTCGSCNGGFICDAASGTCISTCIPNCSGKNCGSDGCSGTCGTCPSNNICDTTKGQCVALCTPDCSGKNCGSDGCSGSCGNCSAGYNCNLGVCSTDLIPSNYKEIILAAHSDARSKYSIPDLVWNASIESVAKSWASSCTYGFNTKVNYLGENIAVGDKDNKLDTLLAAWVAQKNNYDCLSQKCVGQCNQFLQMLTKATSIGCAINVCTGPRGSGTTGSSSSGASYPGSSSIPTATSTSDPWTYLVCDYYPKTEDLLSAIPVTKCPDYCASNSSCESQGLQCGYTTDGCKQIYCGECTLGSECVNGFCKCIPFTTCSIKNRKCGILFDGCSEVNCGSCADNEICTSDGVCKCAPVTSCKNRTCGTLFDGCNTLDCGSCADGSTCTTDGVCVENKPLTSEESTSEIPTTEEPSTEEPITEESSTDISSTDAIAPINTDIDGNANEDIITCLTCKSNEQCINNTCVCTPTSTCPENYACGTIFNGCEEVSCGACSSSQQCINYTCTSCANCHIMATCVNDSCKCMDGYIGDGHRCVAVPDNPSKALTDWKVIKGKMSAWAIGYNSLDYTVQITCTEDSNQIIEWTHSSLFTKANITFSATIQPQNGSREWGFVIRSNYNGYLKFTYKNGAFYRGTYMNTILREYKIADATWEAGTWKNMSVMSDGKYHLFAVDGKLLSNNYWAVYFGFNDGSFGLYSDGPTVFDNVEISTSSRITLNLLECLTPVDLKSAISTIFSIATSAVTDVVTKCDKKRDLSTAASVTFTLMGNTRIGSSTSMVSSLTSRAMNSHISLRANSIGFQAPIVHSVSPSPSQIMIDPMPTSGLTPGEIIAIAAGSAAFVALVIAGIVGYTSYQKKVKPVGPSIDDKELNMGPLPQTDNTETSEKKEKRINVNPLTQSGNPRTHNYSITARNIHY